MFYIYFLVACILDRAESSFVLNESGGTDDAGKTQVNERCRWSILTTLCNIARTNQVNKRVSHNLVFVNNIWHGKRKI